MYHLLPRRRRHLRSPVQMTNVGGDDAINLEGVVEVAGIIRQRFDGVKRHLIDFLELADPETLDALPPLDRAGVLLVLAGAVSALSSLRLRCTGVYPQEHELNAELERLILYQEKLARFNDMNNAPRHPSTALNQQAAARVIGHSLSGLTLEQKNKMRAIGRGGNRNRLDKRNDRKKRKWQSSDRKSIQEEAQEFLVKAARELLGPQETLVKGPFGMCNTDGEDGLVD